MIPRTLQIKNFLSYGTDCPPISFDHHNLICLSGNNGHGKSALLDAMTWALWGCARKIQNSVRADQGLLRLGQNAMLVIFDCTIHSITYRIKREFELVYGKPKTTLEFGIVTDDGTVHTLTEKTIRDTQARINATIGLDYETFTNSSFLRQGNANEFSKRSPKERKEIISTILGLGLYDALKRSALEKGKQAAQESHTLQTLITHNKTEQQNIQTLLAEYPAFATKLSETATILGEYAARIAHTDACIHKEETTKQILTAQLHAYTLQETLYQQLRHELQTLVSTWRTTHAQLKDQGAHAALQLQLQEAKSKHAAAQEKQREYQRLKEAFHLCDQKLMQTAHTIASVCTQIKTDQKIVYERLLNSLQQLHEQLKNLAAQEKTMSGEIVILNKKIADATALMQNLTQQVAPLESLQKMFDKRKETYHRWTTLGNVLRTEQHAQLQRLQLTQDVQNPSCPLCEQSLSAARKRFLQTKIEVRVHIQAHQLARFTRALPRLKEQLIIDHAHLQKITEYKTTLHTLEHTCTQDTNTSKQLAATVAMLVEQIQTLRAKEQELLHRKQELETMQTQEPTNAELITLRAHHQELIATQAQHTARLSALAHDPAVLTTLDTQIKTLHKSLELYEKQSHITALQEERKANIHTLIMKLKKDKQRLGTTNPARDELQKNAATLAILQTEKQKLASEESALRTTYQTLLVEQGKYDAARTTLATLEKTFHDLEQSLQTTDTIASDYQAIAQAVGKDGIQALLIEEAIPEIEEYANNLLAKLTNNTAHIMIESLRDLKSGGTKETLDIKISDTQGVRPYEMFSGGEAFRIDIALRIAISKLLAHRAGTALQTLIIDEGFGSQDEDGLSAMIDVLHTLQSEFAKIIIVSHLPMMKDQFPVHFVVEKRSQGSVVHVIEQG